MCCNYGINTLFAKAPAGAKTLKNCSGSGAKHKKRTFAIKCVTRLSWRLSPFWRAAPFPISLTPSQDAGDPVAGKTVFARCAICHKAAEGAGNSVGT